MIDIQLPNYSEMDSERGRIIGKNNTVICVNPYKCKFIASYPEGRVIQGNNLFETGWDSIPNGLDKLSYILSTGHYIEIPKYKAYLPLIETSIGMDGSRIFHSIVVKCLGETDTYIYKIILKHINGDKLKIGDILISKEPLPKNINNSWKFTG